MPPKSEIVARIRTLLVEASPDFWADDELAQYYDEGTARQHRIILENLTLRQTHRRVAAATIVQENHYLRHFIKLQSIATDGIVAEYALAVDYMRLIAVNHTPALAPRSAVVEKDADEIDWLAQQLPHFKASSLIPRYTIGDDGKIAFYQGNATTVPAAGLNFEVVYLRDVIKSGDPVDLADPWNNGPVRYAVGLARAKQGVDPGPWFAQADAEASVILPSPPVEERRA